MGRLTASFFALLFTTTTHTPVMFAYSPMSNNRHKYICKKILFLKIFGHAAYQPGEVFTLRYFHVELLDT